MASYHYYLKDKGKETTSIYLQFDDGVNRGKFYIQQSISPKDWNPEKEEARKSLTGFSDFNSKLKTIQDKCIELHTLLTNEGKFTIENLRDKFSTFLNKLNGRKRATASGENKTFERLTDFATYYLDNAVSLKKKGSINANRQTVRLLTEFETLKRTVITFDRVNLDFYADFVDFLTKRRGMATNTIGKHITTLKVFLNEATERGINKKFDYKSKRFKSISEPTEKIYLTEPELLKIYEFDFSGNKRLERTRDLFIIGCWTGLRFSDFSQLNPANIKGGEIKVRTQKTDDIVVIPIHPTVREILNKYSVTEKGLPRPMSNQKMNDYLKEIGEKVGIDEMTMLTKTKAGMKVITTVPKYELITTHCARRSFASNLFLSGFPAISIMKITGHKTEKAFMRYIRISQEENAKLLRIHWAENTPLRAVKG